MTMKKSKLKSPKGCPLLAQHAFNGEHKNNLPQYLGFSKVDSYGRQILVTIKIKDFWEYHISILCGKKVCFNHLIVQTKVGQNSAINLWE